MNCFTTGQYTFKSFFPMLFSHRKYNQKSLQISETEKMPVISLLYIVYNFLKNAIAKFECMSLITLKMLDLEI